MQHVNNDVPFDAGRISNFRKYLFFILILVIVGKFMLTGYNFMNESSLYNVATGPNITTPSINNSTTD